MPKSASYVLKYIGRMCAFILKAVTNSATPGTRALIQDQLAVVVIQSFAHQAPFLSHVFRVQRQYVCLANILS